MAKRKSTVADLEGRLDEVLACFERAANSIEGIGRAFSKQDTAGIYEGVNAVVEDLRKTARRCNGVKD